jgi:hypothetical protein
MAETTTATATMEAQTRKRHGYAIERLLHRLRRFVRVYPMKVDDVMPEHDLVWVEELSGASPGKAILDALKANPELWRDALPPEVCIVSRKALEQCGLSADIINHLADMGDHFVGGHAAKFRYVNEI